MKIKVLFDDGLLYSEQESVKEAVQQLRRLFPEITIQFGTNYDSGMTRIKNILDKSIGSAERIRRHGSMPQVDVVNLINHLYDGFKKAYIKSTDTIYVFVLSKDLNKRGAGVDFRYGMTRIARGQFITVQSVYRLWHLGVKDTNESESEQKKQDEKTRLAIMAAILHEVGHILTLMKKSKVSKVALQGGIHCENDGCAMRHGETLDERIENLRQALAMERIYCPQCLNKMRRNLRSE